MSHSRASDATRNKPNHLQRLGVKRTEKFSEPHFDPVSFGEVGSFPEDFSEVVTATPMTSWRDELSLRAAKVSSALFVIATLILFFAEGTSHRPVMLATMFACGLGHGIIGVTRHPAGRFRAWLVVAPAVAASLVAFASAGFLVGPGILLMSTLILSGLLLGQSTMFRLTAIASTGIAGIGWAVIQGVIPLPSPGDKSLQDPIVWFRTIVALTLAITMVGSMLVEIIRRLESSLEQVSQESARRKEAERDKAHLERLSLENRQFEAVGRLAGGVAHDFNNNLTAIIGSAELLKSELASTAQLELVDDILVSSRRAADLTRQLLVYSRKAPVVLKPVDCHDHIERVVEMAQRSFDPNVEITTQFDAENASILADPSLLENAILNLLVNGRDAMPFGGRLRVVTSNCEFKDPSDEHSPPGTGLLLEVLDTGEGIQSDALPKIFEPFYSTKLLGKGAGLGLAAVQGTIRSFNGRIEVESEPGTGSAFRIYLPCHQSHSARILSVAAEIVHGHGRILLVDDNALVRRSAASTLSQLGYEVTVAVDGLHALEVCRAETAPFDVIILDLQMPRMNGEVTFERLTENGVRTPILIWSGYGGEANVNALLKRGAAGFIHKPYQVAELSRIVFEVIHRTESPGSALQTA